uniref:Uncharacterized protein n=1 Tax=Populus alba TaxID=43335 RepID=A0A4U5NAJ8_POPAL|nr:hypothetical protein D5086_0000274610 [Populus alba]
MQGLMRSRKLIEAWLYNTTQMHVLHQQDQKSPQRGYNFKNGKLVRVTKESDRDDREEECKGLLSKEIERWKKQQERSSSTHVEAPSASTTTPSKCKHLSSS